MLLFAFTILFGNFSGADSNTGNVMFIYINIFFPELSCV